MFVPSSYQEAIFRFVQEGSGDGIVNAVAGAGKSTTLVESAKRVSSSSVLFCAFNKHIAEEINRRLSGTSATARTIHSIGYGCLAQAIGGKIVVRDIKYRKLTQEWMDHFYPLTFLNAKDENFRTWRSDQQRALGKMVDLCRLTLTDPKNPFAVMATAIRFGINIEDKIIQGIEMILDRGATIAKDGRVIDYTDMVYLPYRWHLQPSRVRFMLVDECLPYHIPVLLANGTSLPIGEIVENQKPVEVLSYDVITGEQRICRVTGWSKTLNQKPLVKITARWKQKKGTNYPTNFVVCTHDHKIWADNQWIQAQDLQSGMTVQIETSAAKTQTYKISDTGKQVLSQEMTTKNNDGRGGHGSGYIPSRGGNGRGLTVPEQTLLDALGSGWQAGFVVPIPNARRDGYPTHYKIDLADPERMIAVEVDGESHRSRQDQDDRKTAYLESHGWTVIRFSNRVAVQQTDLCVQTISELIVCSHGECPIDAVIESIEPVTIPDYYVYDLTVEDCHNFYANGILVHNCQDLNAAQLDLVLKCRDNGGRMLFVGDPYQSIMGFSGADDQSYYKIRDRTQATELPLSICYRCPKSHLDLARAIVAHIEPSPNAQDGTVVTATEDHLPSMAREGDLIICRRTAPLVTWCIRLIQNRIPARVRGREIGRDLADMARAIGSIGTYESFGQALAAYEDHQAMKLMQREGSEGQLESLRDRCEALHSCYITFQCSTIESLAVEIEALFSDDRPAVMLATVHRTKGLENDRVMVLYPEDMPLKWEKQQPWEYQQEQNVKYVSLTRAKNELVLLEHEPVKEEK